MAASTSTNCDSPEHAKVSQLPEYLKLSRNLHVIAPTDVLNINHTPRSRVKVTLSRTIKENNGISRLEYYKMTSKPRGYALIVNNINFEDEEHYPTRKGAENDEIAMQEMLRQFYFIVETHRNKKYSEMRNIVNTFSQKQEFSNVDCLFVVFMSHGAEGQSENDTEVMGTDGIGLKTTDIVSCFLSDNCPLLVHKPKIFLFQSCRGNLTDPGVTIDHLYHHRTETDGKRMNNYQIFDAKVRTTSDILIAHPVAPGRKANRDIYNGAWFIQSIVKVFSEHAHAHNIEDLFKLVDKDIKKMNNYLETNFQAVTITTMGWNKLLFFNPGLYKVNGRVIKESSLTESNSVPARGEGTDTVDVVRPKCKKNKKYDRLKDNHRNGEDDEEDVGCCGTMFSNCRIRKRTTSLP